MQSAYDIRIISNILASRSRAALQIARLAGPDSLGAPESLAHLYPPQPTFTFASFRLECAQLPSSRAAPQALPIYKAIYTLGVEDY